MAERQGELACLAVSRSVTFNAYEEVWPHIYNYLYVGAFVDLLYQLSRGAAARVAIIMQGLFRRKHSQKAFLAEA